MKFGYHTVRWGFQNVSRFFPRILNEISDAGFKAFETHDIDIVPFIENKKGFIDILSENEMHLVGVYCPGQFITKSFIDWLILNFYLKEIKRFTQFAEFVASIGGEKLIVGGTVGMLGTTQKHYITLGNKLNAIGRVCNNLNLKLTYHPHLKTLVANREQVDSLCRLTDPDLVNFTLETGHLYIAGVNLGELINTYSKRINHVHFKDVKDGKFADLGEGVIDFLSLMKALKGVGYDGWVIVEDEVNSPDLHWAGLSKKTPLQTAKNSKKYVEALSKTR